jgi:hypothetical protein
MKGELYVGQFAFLFISERVWRQWRSGHIRQINKILQSVDEIPSSLAELAALSTGY